MFALKKEGKMNGIQLSLFDFVDTPDFCVIDDISEQCEQLKSENSELKARLEKAVEDE